MTEYSYPKIIWNDENDNCVLDEYHEMTFSFDDFRGKLIIYDCDDDQDAIAKAQATAQTLKGLQCTFETYKVLKNTFQKKDGAGDSEISEKLSNQFSSDQGQ